MKYIVLSDKVSGDSYYYENKNALEEKYLFMAITLANPRRLVISTSSDISNVKGVREIQSVAELFALISSIALKEVAICM